MKKFFMLISILNFSAFLFTLWKGGYDFSILIPLILGAFFGIMAELQK